MMTPRQTDALACFICDYDPGYGQAKAVYGVPNYVRATLATTAEERTRSCQYDQRQEWDRRKGRMFLSVENYAQQVADRPPPPNAKLDAALSAWMLALAEEGRE